MAKNILPLTIQVRSTEAWKAWVVDTANAHGLSIPDLIDEAFREWAERRKIAPPPDRVGEAR